MTTSTAAADEMSDAARTYTRKYGWLADAEGWTVWAIAGRPVEAIDAPRSVAEPALARLREHDRHGPVVAHPGLRPRWVFLVEPGVPHNSVLLARLSGLGAHWLCNGARIYLPPTGVFSHELTWIERPTRPLAQFTTVARALLGAPCSC